MRVTFRELALLALRCHRRQHQQRLRLLNPVVAVVALLGK
jgi:hypothetical protein